MTLAITARQDRLEFAVKVVPGASRDRIAGLYGDALKVQVAAPPERGRANAAVCALLAAALSLPERAVVVAAGASSPRKTIAVRGVTADELRRRLLG